MEDLPIHIKGEVVPGKKIAQKFLVPTANIKILQPENYFPPFGVYAAALKFDRKWYQGVASVGVAETFDDIKKPKLEVHLFDFDADLYGHFVDVRLMYFLREMKRFSGVDELKKQIDLDILDAKAYFDSINNA